jgi:hypothetical protein
MVSRQVLGFLLLKHALPDGASAWTSLFSDDFDPTLRAAWSQAFDKLIVDPSTPLPGDKNT